MREVCFHRMKVPHRPDYSLDFAGKLSTASIATFFGNEKAVQGPGQQRRIGWLGCQSSGFEPVVLWHTRPMIGAQPPHFGGFAGHHFPPPTEQSVQERGVDALGSNDLQEEHLHQFRDLLDGQPDLYLGRFLRALSELALTNADAQPGGRVFFFCTVCVSEVNRGVLGGIEDKGLVGHGALLRAGRFRDGTSTRFIL